MALQTPIFSRSQAPLPAAYSSPAVEHHYCVDRFLLGPSHDADPCQLWPKGGDENGSAVLSSGAKMWWPCA